MAFVSLRTKFKIFNQGSDVSNLNDDFLGLQNLVFPNVKRD